MPKRALHRVVHTLDRHLDRRRRPREGKIVVSPYRGFGRGNEMLLRGRVLVEKSVTRARAAESIWRNLLNTYHRFMSDEVAGAKVRVSYRDAVVETVSDAEGHFQVLLKPKEMADKTLWHKVAVELPEHGTSAVTEVMIPSDAASYAVISDIDDTIVQTNATSLLRMVRSIVNNAAARLPFEGVAELYKALHAERNPIFYVSSSPWNLYELLHDYMDLNAIPHGPMFLQDWGIDEKTLILADHTEHKLAQIQTLLDFYPELRWVLIGDSGQHDPEIYLEVIRAHPGKVLAAFIRDVTPDVRDKAVTAIANEIAAHGVELVYVKDSKEALAHAQRLKLL
ncbi:MAG TPA: phosphatase domain-containing protein [Thermoanaerobaculia bacterium]|nr:phosphatase domain-containing protein [Thermoanaerobaculia bacterium]